MTEPPTDALHDLNNTPSTTVSTCASNDDQDHNSASRELTQKTVRESSSQPYSGVRKPPYMYRPFLNMMDCTEESSITLENQSDSLTETENITVTDDNCVSNISSSMTVNATPSWDTNISSTALVEFDERIIPNEPVAYSVQTDIEHVEPQVEVSSRVIDTLSTDGSPETPKTVTLQENYPVSLSLHDDNDDGYEHLDGNASSHHSPMQGTETQKHVLDFCVHDSDHVLMDANSVFGSPQASASLNVSSVNDEEEVENRDVVEVVTEVVEEVVEGDFDGQEVVHDAIHVFDQQPRDAVCESYGENVSHAVEEAGDITEQSFRKELNQTEDVSEEFEDVNLVLIPQSDVDVNDEQSNLTELMNVDKMCDGANANNLETRYEQDFVSNSVVDMSQDECCEIPDDDEDMVPKGEVIADDCAEMSADEKVKDDVTEMSVDDKVRDDDREMFVDDKDDGEVSVDDKVKDDREVSVDDKFQDDDGDMSADGKVKDDDGEISADDKVKDDDGEMSADDKVKDDDGKMSADDEVKYDDGEMSADAKVKDESAEMSADVEVCDDGDMSANDKVKDDDGEMSAGNELKAGDGEMSGDDAIEDQNSEIMPDDMVKDDGGVEAITAGYQILRGDNDVDRKAGSMKEVNPDYQELEDTEIDKENLDKTQNDNSHDVDSADFHASGSEEKENKSDSKLDGSTEELIKSDEMLAAEMVTDDEIASRVDVTYHSRRDPNKESNACNDNTSGENTHAKLDATTSNSDPSAEITTNVIDGQSVEDQLQPGSRLHESVTADNQDMDIGEQNTIEKHKIDEEQNTAAETEVAVTSEDPEAVIKSEDDVKQELPSSEQEKEGLGDSPDGQLDKEENKNADENILSILKEVKDEKDSEMTTATPDLKVMRNTRSEKAKGSKQKKRWLTRADLFVKPVIKVKRLDTESLSGLESSAEERPSLPKKRKTEPRSTSSPHSATVSVKCEHCPKVCSDHNKLKQHVTARHKDGNPGKSEKHKTKLHDPKVCPKCKTKFTNVGNVVRHLRNVHKIQNASASTLSTFNIQINSRSVAKVNNTKKIPTPVTGTSKSTPKKNDGIESSNQEAVCFICEKHFALYVSLKKHIVQAHKTNKNVLSSYEYPCMKCGKLLSNSVGLQKHNAYCIAKDMVAHKLKCESCNKVFKDKVALNNHEKDTHRKASEELKKCRCGKKFSQTSNLKRHMFMCAVAKKKKVPTATLR